MDDLDPFTMVYNGLWDMVDTNKKFGELLREGNTVRFKSRASVRKNVSTNDLPELALVPSDTIGNFQASSSESECTKDYEWVISTGDVRLAEFLYPLEWFLFTSMITWQTKLTPLKWQGKSFVKAVQYVNARTGMSEKEHNRGIKGWVTVQRFSVRMRFSSVDLVGETQ